MFIYRVPPSMFPLRGLGTDCPTSGPSTHTDPAHCIGGEVKHPPEQGGDRGDGRTGRNISPRWSIPLVPVCTAAPLCLGRTVSQITSA